MLIFENKTFGIILKEAKLFDDNINYQSSGIVNGGNKVLLLGETFRHDIAKLEDEQRGWMGN